MTAALCFTLLALLWQAPQAQPGVVHGVITRTGTTETVAGVQVSLIPGTFLIPPDAFQGIVFGAPPGPTVVSDQDGKFSFKDLVPGRYTVRLQREGVFAAKTNPATVAVSAGGNHEINLSVIPGAVVRGRVRDASGQFASNVSVQAYAIEYQNGLPVLRPGVSKMTDDRGEYRLFSLGPGDYYIGVLPRAGAANSTPGSGTVRSTRTFFPSAVDVSRAGTITVKGGEEIANIDIAMQSTRYLRISGRVVSDVRSRALPPDAGGPGVFGAIAQAQNNMANVLLVPRDVLAADEPGPKFTASVLLNGSSAEFELHNVPVGRYELFAVATAQQGIALGRIAVDVFDQDAVGVSVVARSGAVVKGTLSEGTPAMPARISLVPLDSLARANILGLQTGVQSGQFTFPSVPDAHYRVLINLAPSHYVADILQNGRSVYDSGFAVQGGSPDPLEIVVKAGAASIEGLVQDRAGGAGAGATVGLVPATRRENMDLYKTVTADTAGKFSIRGVAPGDYKLFAWTAAPAGAASSSAFVAKYEEQGQAITLSPEAALTMRVIVSEERPR
jgi:hypothetical protein